MEDIKYWFYGYPAVRDTTTVRDVGGEKYWFYGYPTIYKVGGSAPPTPGTSPAFRLTLLGAG